MTRWHGHSRKTSTYLLGVLAKAQAGESQFSYAERALYSACEFWAATMNNALAHHLAGDAEAVLRDAEESFGVIGISSVVKMLHGARGHLHLLKPGGSVRRLAAILQKSLKHLEEPVDDLIAQFAAEQTWSLFEGSNDGGKESMAAIDHKLRKQ